MLRDVGRGSKGLQPITGPVRCTSSQVEPRDAFPAPSREGGRDCAARPRCIICAVVRKPRNTSMGKGVRSDNARPGSGCERVELKLRVKGGKRLDRLTTPCGASTPRAPSDEGRSRTPTIEAARPVRIVRHVALSIDGPGTCVRFAKVMTGETPTWPTRAWTFAAC